MMQRKRPSYLCSLLMIPLFLLVACSSTPKNDYDLNYDFSRLKSFSQLAPSENSDPLSASRIQQAIASSLTSQGFTPQAKEADFSVAYGFKVEDKPKDSGFSIGLGTGTWGSSGGASIGTSVDVPVGSNTAKIQTIQIDIIDPKTNQLIWRGTDKFNFDDGGEAKAEETKATVAKILAQFPPKTEK
ncbi:DUF4136 domain-containing protein [Shewanella schlegeliana]|uniref:DUF4136 domain-containing protein n=1 Tax=Shewanella schlegeliana TaxID=190308 RepID=A0ABS1SUW6_9GAMM|nr:DUF4136 domain-containing protein [Shewanella schlegeliana]MBL4912337.1 DUF4136 domain-containing protein [Shewanella schlegeliana]MCL1108194.1 DUF4136 domain-containing protein [Shewanella schlegeliana]GIU22140.1 hypothetical protein TUM4433_02520 [Shewanella schlegeliana]